MHKQHFHGLPRYILYWDARARTVNCCCFFTYTKKRGNAIPYTPIEKSECKRKIKHGRVNVRLFTPTVMVETDHFILHECVWVYFSGDTMLNEKMMYVCICMLGFVYSSKLDLIFHAPWILVENKNEFQQSTKKQQHTDISINDVRFWCFRAVHCLTCSPSVKLFTCSKCISANWSIIFVLSLHMLKMTFKLLFFLLLLHNKKNELKENFVMPKTTKTKTNCGGGIYSIHQKSNFGQQIEFMSTI